MVDKVMHWGIISSIINTNLTPLYTTVNNNELIEFKTADGTQRVVNSLTIWSGTSALYVQMGDTSYCVYIPANSFISVDYLAIKNMTVLANAGATLRYIAMYY